ncbi:MAG: HAD-IC family P-type ATPase, partial [Patescibacteria group bacterium]|nr:HAD-IC family P-type ATPase [Patescibacteria group bacterium]
MTNKSPAKTIKNLHIKPYTKEPKKLFKLLSSQKKGLSSQQASSRLAQFGPNQIKHKKSFTILGLIWDQFSDILTLILVIAAAFSFFIGEKIDAIAIASILLINGVLGFVQEYKAEQSLEDLKHIETLTTVVLRNNKEREISAKDLVPGDVIFLSEGDRIPADARLLESYRLEVDESMLTGESTPTHKNTDIVSKNTALGDRSCMVFSGCVVTRGRATALVIRTGMKTEIGKIADELYQAEDRDTPLQKALAHLGKVLGIISLLVAVPGLIIGIIKGRDLVEMMMLAISLSVSVIPEGLPVVVTMAL